MIIGEQHISVIAGETKEESFVLNKQINSTFFDDVYCFKYSNKHEKLTKYHVDCLRNLIDRKQFRNSTIKF